jgi:hypothetical protein
MNDGYLITPEMFTGRIKALIYGDPGSGKTWLAGTAQDHPGLRNVHFFNVDGGMYTLAERGDISATDVRSLDHLEAELFRITSGDEKYKGVRTFVIDNITELQTLNLEDIVREELRKKTRREKDATIDDVYQDDYGKSTKQMARILRGFRDIPFNVLYIAHRKDKMRKKSDVIEESKPSLTEKLCTAVMGYMDFVWYLYTMDVPTPVDEQGRTANVTHRFLLTQPFNGFICKTRGTKFSTNLGMCLQDPTMPDIYEVFLKSGSGSTNQ